MAIKTLKKFLKEYSYIKSALKPQYKKYFDDLADFYLQRKITNIKTVENHFNKLNGKGAKATTAKLDKLFDKFQTFNNLPSHTQDYQPTPKKQTREDRLRKFNEGIYENKGDQVKRKIDKSNIALKEFQGISRDILNGAFSEVTIRSEPFNALYSKKQLYRMYRLAKDEETSKS